LAINQKTNVLCHCLPFENFRYKLCGMLDGNRCTSPHSRAWPDNSELPGGDLIRSGCWLRNYYS